MLSWCGVVAAQSDESRFQVGAQFTAVVSDEFDDTDWGVGGRFSWQPTVFLGSEAELAFYPADLPDARPFSRGRLEGLFGVTIGPRLGGLRPFARVRPGFLTLHEAPGPLVCIQIFPPPLSCTLASGRTLFALDLGGGIEFFPAGSTFIRMDAGDRLVRYPGEVLDLEGRARDDVFFSHDFRFAIGAGMRF
jgi:hypothetical protein